MKAAVYQSPGAPDVLRYKDVANPRCPTNGVLIKVEAISVEGGDLTNRASGPPRLCRTPEGSSDTRPQARSSLSALTCVIGSSDKKSRRSTCTGPHASLRAVVSDRTWIIPDGLSVSAAAACRRS